MLLDKPWLQELGTNEVANWMLRHCVIPEGPLKITHMPGNLIMQAAVCAERQAGTPVRTLLALFSRQHFHDFMASEICR